MDSQNNEDIPFTSDEIRDIRKNLLVGWYENSDTRSKEVDYLEQISIHRLFVSWEKQGM